MKIIENKDDALNHRQSISNFWLTASAFKYLISNFSIVWKMFPILYYCLANKLEKYSWDIRVWTEHTIFQLWHGQLTEKAALRRAAFKVSISICPVVLSIELGSCFCLKIGQRARKTRHHDLSNSSHSLHQQHQLLTRHFLQSHFSILTFTAWHIRPPA